MYRTHLIFQKTEYNVTEYGISMASLEQIFNKFAKEAEGKKDINVLEFLIQTENGKSKIDITEALLESVDIKIENNI